MIDRSLSYGRKNIENFLASAGSYYSVLDLGAGKGDDLLLARKFNPKASLHAIEAYHEYAQNLSKKNINVHCLNIERDFLPFSDGSVNVVIINQVLEHTKEVFWIFHEITRVLPIGGKVILGVPNLASLHNRFLLVLGRQPSSIQNNSEHVRGFTKGDMLKLINTFPKGYELKAFAGSNFYPFPPLIAKPLAKAFPTMAWGIFFMLEKKREYHREFLDFPQNERLETNFYLG